MDEVKIIPQSVLDQKKEIENALKNENAIGVIFLKSRRSGRRFLRDLIFNTQDAEIVELKQLPESQIKQTV